VAGANSDMQTCGDKSNSSPWAKGTCTFNMQEKRCSSKGNGFDFVVSCTMKSVAGCNVFLFRCPVRYGTQAPVPRFWVDRMAHGPEVQYVVHASFVFLHSFFCLVSGPFDKDIQWATVVVFGKLIKYQFLPFNFNLYSFAL
jgi:hypothetical protein